MPFKSAFRAGAKEQIEVQLIKGLLEDHFVIADERENIGASAYGII